MLRWLSPTLTLLLLSSIVGGCAAESEPGNYDPDDPRLDTAVLEIVPPGTFNLRFEEEATLTVYYHFEDGEPIHGAPIDFEIVGVASGSSLAGRVSDTGSDGMTQMTVRAGTADTTFRVKASPPVGTPVEFLVSVSDDESGSILIEMTYSGDMVFDSYTPYLFRGGTDCGELDPESLPMAERIGSPVPRIVDRPGFVGVAPGDYTVAVIADIAGEPAGMGCGVGVEVAPQMETIVSLEIMDYVPPLRFEGVYDLRNELDFGGALPDSVETALDVLDELTDDQNIDGDAMSEDWGQDPGAFVTDVVMRTTCHWECMSGEDYDSCSEINHRLGDLKLLYTENFTSWEGAQSRFFGGCGAWEVAARTAQEFINMQIGTYVPEIVLRFLDAAGDLSRAVNAAQIESRLTLEPMNEFGQIPFTHELRTMEVRLRDLGGMEHFVTFNLADAGVTMRSASADATVSGEELILPEHTYEIHFGELVQYIYVEHLLPLFGYSSTADMLMDWIDCDAIAARLYMESDLLSEDDYRSACNTGVMLAGDLVDDGIAGVIGEAADLTLSGRCTGGEVTTDRLAQTLDDGVWTGSWDEMGMEGTVAGTFTGRLRP